MAGIDWAALRDDFPALRRTMNGRPLAYLDSGASAQKPQAVIDALTAALTDHYANIHRGLYAFSQAMTADFEAARGKVAAFLNAASPNEIIFTRNATEAINLIAQSWGAAFCRAGDEIVVTQMEHHANLVPWQRLCERDGLTLKVVRVTDDGALDLDDLAAKLSPRTRLLAMVQVSNVLGTRNDIAAIGALLRGAQPEAKLVLDGSQAVVHGAVDVTALGCDFYVFTGHKLYGPSGIGVLWGREDLLNAMPPYQSGGDMVDAVYETGSTYKASPARFEAGTPAIAEAVALGAAIDYLSAIGMDAIAARERALLDYAMAKLNAVEGLTFYGRMPGKAGMMSFTAAWGHPSDIAMILDRQGVAVRSGHHCCQPLHRRFGIDASVRASLGLYSNENDIDQLVGALDKAKDLLG